MSKSVVWALALCPLVLGLANEDCSAQGQPAAKATVQVSSGKLIDSAAGEGGWQSVIGSEDPASSRSVRIKTASQKDLILGVALECGLYTSTLVRSKGEEKDTSMAEASIRVRVLLDPGTPDERIASPGEVVFSRRSQSLSATLQGVIENLDVYADGVFDPTSPYLSPEEIELLLDTLSANAFFFALDDVGSGTHNMVVQARIDSGGGSQEGSFTARGCVGLGALTVEEHRFVKGEDIVLE